MSVRRAVHADAAALSAIHGLSFDDGWTTADFETWLARPEAIAMVAGDTRPTAFGLALEAGADAELLTIATDPASRHTGLGRRIFHALDAEALNRGLERWVLEVARNNLPAIDQDIGHAEGPSSGHLRAQGEWPFKRPNVGRA